jgi:hypothetical protein
MIAIYFGARSGAFLDRGARAGLKPDMARASKKQAKQIAQDTLASRIAARWGGNGGEVAVDRLASELTEAQRYDIVAALKELEKAGAGTFEVGRAGRKARFIWSGKLPKSEPDKPAAKAKERPQAREAGRLELAQRVKLASKRLPGPKLEPKQAPESKRAALPTRTDANKPSRTAELEHHFHLRPGFVAGVRLPADVTRSEIARFCQFLQAIPFADER